MTHFPDIDTFRKVQVDFTIAAAKAFAQAFGPTSEGKPFGFVFCSGKFSEWDQTKRVAFLQDTRRMKVRIPPLSFSDPLESFLLCLPA